MRNPVLPYRCVVSLAVAAVIGALGGCVSSPSPGDSFEPSVANPLTPVSIVARGASGVRLEVVLAADQSWTATLAGSGGQSRVTDRTCTGFRDAIAAYTRLPPLRPAPVLLIPDRPSNLPLAPRAPHAEYWVITTAGYAPDWSHVDLEIRGSQGPYALWVNDTVEAIRSCASTAS